MDQEGSALPRVHVLSVLCAVLLTRMAPDRIAAAGDPRAQAQVAPKFKGGRGRREQQRDATR